MAPTQEDAEIEALLAQVAQLECELAEQAAQAGAAVAAAEDRPFQLAQEHAEAVARKDAEIAELTERLYWLDHWNIDLNEVMRRPGADQARALARGVRDVVRFFMRIKHGLFT